MATRTFTLDYDAGASLKCAVFQLSDGKVFDFDSNSFVLLSAPPVTPYVAATELAAPAGADSLYKAAFNLALINATSTPADFVIYWYTDTNLTACISAGTRIEVVSGDLGGSDVSALAAMTAVLTDPMPELTEIPPAEPTLVQALMLDYMKTRNKRETSNTADKIHNDAGDVIGTQSLNDDGTKLTRGKAA